MYILLQKILLYFIHRGKKTKFNTKLEGNYNKFINYTFSWLKTLQTGYIAVNKQSQMQELSNFITFLCLFLFHHHVAWPIWQIAEIVKEIIVVNTLYVY